MITLRRFLSAQYDWTGIASKLLQSKAWYLGSLISVAFIVLLLIVGYHLWYVGMAAKDFATTPFGLDHMFPLITYYTLTVILASPVALVLACLPHLAAHHGWRKAGPRPAFSLRARGLGLRVSVGD